jgi:tetratricopeptide (TPR) repeat protein
MSGVAPQRELREYLGLRPRPPLQPALALFKLNVHLFPTRWNTYHNLAEAYKLAGNHALASENYRRAVVLNPQNTNGAAQLKQLLDATQQQEVQR